MLRSAWCKKTRGIDVHEAITSLKRLGLEMQIRGRIFKMSYQDLPVQMHVNYPDFVPHSLCKIANCANHQQL